MTIAEPVLHFTPPADWMNDPNGLVYLKGIWHLFYQLQPAGSDHKHWGHAVSRDLAHWEHLLVALFPDELGAIWSGSCVVDHDDTSGFFDGGQGLVAIFTHHIQTTSGQSQSQSLAYSRDEGNTWTKYERNPVLTSDRPDFRDPKVFWHKATDSWVMIVSAGGESQIYRSPDLKAWTLASSFGAGSMPGRIWECPDLFPLRDENGQEVWILLSSFVGGPNAQGQSGNCFAAYFAGDFDGYRFATKEKSGGIEPHRLSFGPDDYAPVTFSNAPEGRQVLLGWLNNWNYADDMATFPWIGQMTLPRDLKWRQGSLIQTLSPELEAARFWPTAVMPSLENKASELRLSGSLWEVELPAHHASWLLEAREGGNLIFSISRDATRGMWTMKRDENSLPLAPAKRPGRDALFTSPHEAPLSPLGDATPTRLIVDACSVEAFCDAGRTLFCFQIFPHGSDCTLSWREV